jgi:hypothetical protein
MRRTPAKPPAQPVGMAESDMNKSSWQKPASLHTAAATKSIGALIGTSAGCHRIGALVVNRGWKVRPKGRRYHGPPP